MWQRKQTIYLIAVLFLTIVVAYSDIVSISNYLVRGSILSGIDVLTGITTIASIVMYSNRKRQMKLCRLIELLLIIWLAYYGYDHYYIHGGAVRYPLYAMLPAVNIVLAEMAYRGVQHDEALIRSADRIR